MARSRRSAAGTNALGVRRPWISSLPGRGGPTPSSLPNMPGIDPGDFEAVKAAAESIGIATAGKDPAVVTSELFEAVVEDKLTGPIFVIDYPAAICPLTKRKASNPAVAERFELYVHGVELANAYTELTDPLLQEELFRQPALRALPRRNRWPRWTMTSSGPSSTRCRRPAGWASASTGSA